MALDTVEANERLGLADLRNCGVGLQILTDLGIHRLRLLTNNPRKIAGLGGYGLQVEERVPLVMDAGDHNADYLAAKRDKLGHLMDNDGPCTAGLAVKDRESGQPSAHGWKTIARIHGQTLEALHEPRLLALWDRPQFVWKLDSMSRIQWHCSRPGDSGSHRRIGLLRVPTNAVHSTPSQTLEREEHAMQDLIHARGDGLLERPSLLHWTDQD